MIPPKVILLRKDRMNYVLKGISDHYNTTPEEVLKHARKPNEVLRKRIAIKLLKDVADCTYKDISILNGDNEGNLNRHYVTIREDMEYDTKIKTTYNLILKNLLQ